MIKKYVLIAAGITSLSVGVVGMFLPILPTTPFVLLAAVLFLRSSRALYIRLVRNKVFGKYLKSYLKYRALTVKSKIISITVLWVLILCSVFFFTSLLWLRIVLLLVASGVTIHLVALRTLKKDAGN